MTPEEKKISLEKLEKWKKDNPERAKQAGIKRHKLWSENNPDKVKAQRDRRKDKQREYYKNNKNRWKQSRLHREYGISHDDYLLLLKSQNYKCAICKCEKCPTGKDFAIDHSHKTKEIRGVLCKNCNIGIGMFFDNVQFLSNAIEYLEKKCE